MLDCRYLIASAWLLHAINAVALSGGEPANTEQQLEFFETHVRPVLVAHCYECHSTDARELKAELYVDSREGMLKGGESGPAIIVGKPNQSPLIEAVRYEANEMPPDRKLSARQIAALSKWVEMGAPWPQVTSSTGVFSQEKEIDWNQARAEHWAWHKVERPSVPIVKDPGAVNEIDLFVAARRDAARLRSNQPASPRVLVRRVFVDLIGVLPTSDQVRDFEIAAEHNPQRAVESLVDRLLQSPMYGQRWARHWLDVARYSDGHGGFLDNQKLDNAWRYRDWVVDALNADIPVDQFLRLQVAGDLVGDRDDAIATGFFACGPTYRSDGGDPDSIAQAKGETLDDRVDTLTRGLLGITGSCARCHDHKFDPIPQLDYYSLAGIFHNSDVHSLPLADQDVVDRVAEHNRRLSELKNQTKKLQQQLKNEKRKASASELAQLSQWKNERERLERNPPPGYDTAHTLRDNGSEDMHVAIRGNLRKTGELAPRRFLRVLSQGEPPDFTAGSGRRELAEAIVDRDNPLTARVFVNRIWMHHFGDGLVRTPSNFGTLGQPPTHPHLLDWLAADFVQNGWSLKRLHRQIMTSATYQLGSAYDEDCFRLDADNRLLWRMKPRRMDVEAWRDSLLAITGELDDRPGGSPVADISTSTRRTLYAKVSRNGDVFQSDEFLRRFDFPLMRATVAQRPKSIVPQQYLFLLNSHFMVARAKAMVSRLESVATSDAEKIDWAYRTLYGRSAQPSEIQLGLEFLRESGSMTSEPAVTSAEKLSMWDQYAQVLLSSNELMFLR